MNRKIRGQIERQARRRKREARGEYGSRVLELQRITFSCDRGTHPLGSAVERRHPGSVLAWHRTRHRFELREGNSGAVIAHAKRRRRCLRRAAFGGAA